MAPISFTRDCRWSDAKYHSHAATPISWPVSKRWVPKTAAHSSETEECPMTLPSPMARTSSVSTACSDSPIHSDLSSTDTSDDDSSVIFCDCASSDSEHDDDFEMASQTHVYSVNMLLRMRSFLSADQETLHGVKYHTCYMHDGTCSQLSRQTRVESWQAHQRKGTTDDDAKVLRAARSILNKLTLEKFEALLHQLTSCGIQKPHHISMLMHEIFEKATIQHSFIPMYADLCARLESDPTISDVVKMAGESHNFRRLLLNQCQVVFEQVLEPSSVETEQADADEEIGFRRKQRALGNMKLIGHLLVDGMLSSDLFVQCCEELLHKRSECSEALEALVALIMVAGPCFDNRSWQLFGRFEKILGDMKSLTKDKQTPTRLRFLIRDVLDARAAGWPSSPKIVMKAEHITESKQTDGSLCRTARQSLREAGKTDIPAAAEKKFDIVAFRRTLATVLSDLASDKNIPAAVQSIRAQEVPLAFQADQFVDILSRVVEERRGAVRRCQLAFIAGLVAAENSALDRQECLSGLKRFFEDAFEELCKDVHRLPGIMKSEFMPTMLTVVPATDINCVVPPAMRK